MLGALGVEHVEGVPQVREEIVAGVEALGRPELHVVVVERIRDDQMRRAVHLDPVRQVVVVGVSVVEEAAGFHHEPPRVGAEPSRVPAERTLARHVGEAVDGQPDVLALDGLAHELVIDPAPAVAHHLVAGFDDRAGGLGMALEGHRHREHADVDPAFREELQEAPEADAASVLVDRLDLEVPNPTERLAADDFLQERLCLGVAVEDRPLAALLVVHDDLEREPRAVRPLRAGRGPPITDQITGIGHRGPGLYAIIQAPEGGQPWRVPTRSSTPTVTSSSPWTCGTSTSTRASAIARPGSSSTPTARNACSSRARSSAARRASASSAPSGPGKA